MTNSILNHATIISSEISSISQNIKTIEEKQVFLVLRHYAMKGVGESGRLTLRIINICTTFG
jgi:hypothetical protein